VGEEVVHLLQRVVVGGGLLPALQHVARAVGVLADAGVDDDLEEEAVVGEAEALVALDDVAGHLGGDLAVVGGLVARVVQEVAARAAAARHGLPRQVRHGVCQQEDGKQGQHLHGRGRWWWWWVGHNK